MSDQQISLAHRLRYYYLNGKHQFLNCASETGEAGYCCFSLSSGSFKSCYIVQFGLGFRTKEGQMWQLDHAGTVRTSSYFGEEAGCKSVNSNDDDLAYPDLKHYFVDASDCLY